ncbi:MAG: hypothetical protein QG614_137 [Patescibacteria group bacterium]|nr:hypothetical protein [Patescibacteria group bacterium]
MQNPELSSFTDNLKKGEEEEKRRGRWRVTVFQHEVTTLKLNFKRLFTDTIFPVAI